MFELKTLFSVFLTEILPYKTKVALVTNYKTNTNIFGERGANSKSQCLIYEMARKWCLSTSDVVSDSSNRPVTVEEKVKFCEGIAKYPMPFDRTHDG